MACLNECCDEKEIIIYKEAFIKFFLNTYACFSQVIIADETIVNQKK